MKLPGPSQVRAGILLATVLFAGCRRGAGPGAARAGPAPWVNALGRIVPGQRVVHVTAPAAVTSTAVVGQLQVRRQDWVRRGQVLAWLADRGAAAAALAQAGAEVRVAARLLAQAEAGEKTGTLAAQRALVGSAAAALRNAEASHARTRALYQQGILARAEMDASEAAAAEARAALREARARYASLRDLRPVDLAVVRARLAAAEADRRRAEADLALTGIRAPMDGQVLQINAYPGEAIGGAGLLDLGDTRDLMVEADVDVLDLGRVRRGARAFIGGDGLAGEAPGRVEEIFAGVSAGAVPGPDPLANADRRVVRVRVRPDRSGALAGLVDATVQVRILP